jgi:hypothetical protein
MLKKPTHGVKGLTYYLRQTHLHRQVGGYMWCIGEQVTSRS